MTLLTAYFLLIAALAIASRALRCRLDRQAARRHETRRSRLDRKAEVERRARATL